MIIADRNWPEDLEYKSIKYTLDFKWDPMSNLPEQGKVVLEDNHIKVFLPSSHWTNFEDAYRDIITQAEHYIEQNLL